MLRPRWRKVLRDLWSNKTRTLLVVLSIAVGVFAIGMVGGSRVILIRDLTDTWMAVDPPSATLNTEAFDDDLVQVVRKLPGIGRSLHVRDRKAAWVIHARAFRSRNPARASSAYRAAYSIGLIILAREWLSLGRANQPDSRQPFPQAAIKIA